MRSQRIFTHYLYLVIRLSSMITGVSSFSSDLSSVGGNRLVDPLILGSRETENALKLHRMIQDLKIGPLKNQRTTILLSQELEKGSIGADGILKDLEDPLRLIRFPKNPAMDLELEMRSNSSGYHPIPLRVTTYYDETEGHAVHFQTGGVMILITTEDELDLLWLYFHPPKKWSIKAIIVISLSPSCWQKYFLQSPLLQITPSVAVICPSQPQNSPHGSHDFKVWTWLPYARGPKLIDLGFWNPRIFKTWDHLFVDRFKDMSEKTISILAINIDRPFYYARENGEDAGQTYKIVEALGERLNYKLNITGSVTVHYPLIKELVQKGENDVMINLATPTQDRNEDFQLTVPYAYQGFGLMLEIPPPLPRWMNIVYPYSMEVWLWTIGSLLATSVVFHLLYYRHESSFITNTITVSQSLLSNPLDVVPEGWVIKCFLLIWWIGSWMLNLSYTCNLIAILTVPVFPTRIQSAYELAESKYRLCMLDYGEFVPEALRVSKQPTLYTLGARLDLVPILNYMPEMGEEECVDRVLKGTHSHIETYPYQATLYSMWNLNSKVYALREKLYQSHLILLIYKHAPWKYKFDDGMERMDQAGLLQKWYQDSMNEFIGAVADDGSQLMLTALSLSHVQGSFLILGLGLFGSLLLMVAEVLMPPKN